VTEVCSYRWQGPRVEVPDSVPVQHVCALPMGHDGEDQCSCGAATKAGPRSWFASE
jgi:hypothetical protein